jgi:hypothetical protein
VSCGVEIMLDKLFIADDKYPSVPSPCKEEVSCGVEIMLDKLFIADDRYPRVPSPLSEENSEADDIKVEGTEER